MWGEDVPQKKNSGFLTWIAKISLTIESQFIAYTTPLKNHGTAGQTHILILHLILHQFLLSVEAFGELNIPACNCFLISGRHLKTSGYHVEWNISSICQENPAAHVNGLYLVVNGSIFKKNLHENHFFASMRVCFFSFRQCKAICLPGKYSGSP